MQLIPGTEQRLALEHGCRATAAHRTRHAVGWLADHTPVGGRAGLFVAVDYCTPRFGARLPRLTLSFLSTTRCVALALLLEDTGRFHMQAQNSMYEYETYA